MSIVLTDQQQAELEQDVLPQEVPSNELRLSALEQALRFTMENIKVTITLPSPLVGIPPQVVHSNLYQTYLGQLKAAQEVAARQVQAVNNG